MLANREASKRVFPGTFRGAGVRAVDRYPDLLLATLKSMATTLNAILAAQQAASAAASGTAATGTSPAA